MASNDGQQRLEVVLQQLSGALMDLNNLLAEQRQRSELADQTKKGEEKIDNNDNSDDNRSSESGSIVAECDPPPISEEELKAAQEWFQGIIYDELLETLLQRRSNRGLLESLGNGGPTDLDFPGNYFPSVEDLGLRIKVDDKVHILGYQRGKRFGQDTYERCGLTNHQIDESFKQLWETEKSHGRGNYIDKYWMRNYVSHHASGDASSFSEPEESIERKAHEVTRLGLGHSLIITLVDGDNEYPTVFEISLLLKAINWFLTGPRLCPPNLWNSFMEPDMRNFIASLGPRPITWPDPQLITYSDSMSFGSAFIFLRTWTWEEQDKPRAETRDSYDTLRMGVSTVRKHARVEGLEKVLKLKETRMLSGLKICLCSGNMPAFSIIGVIDYSKSRLPNRPKHKGPHGELPRDCGSLVGIETFLTQSSAFIMDWHIYWLSLFDSLGRLLGIDINDSTDKKKWDTIMFDERFVLSQACFTIIQLMRTATFWITDTRQNIESLAAFQRQINRCEAVAFSDRQAAEEKFSQFYNETMEIIVRLESKATGLLDEAKELQEVLFNATSLREAKNGMALNRAIYVFTAVTIVFTPISFLTSFWAMPIVNINSDGSEVTKAQPGFFGTFIIIPLVTYLLCLVAAWYYGSETAELLIKLFKEKMNPSLQPLRDLNITIKDKLRKRISREREKRPNDV